MTLILTGPVFQGFKLLPPGLHLFVVSAAPTSTQNLAGGVGVRHGLLRFFSAGETVVRGWDNAHEEFARAAGDDQRAPKRRRTAIGSSDEAGPGTVVVSSASLRSLDQHLAAYPPGLDAQWKALTSFVSRATLARVVGLDAEGNAVTNAVVGSTADEEELKAAGGRQTWGKVREEDTRTELDDGDEDDVETLAFVRVDLKRSWPPGAVGQDLTRWSQDKSWLLSSVVAGQLEGGALACSSPARCPPPPRVLTYYPRPADIQELLAEFQLSFVLFTLLHNFSSLAAYKALFALVARSSTVLLPPSARPSTESPSAKALLTVSFRPLPRPRHLHIIS